MAPDISQPIVAFPEPGLEVDHDASQQKQVYGYHYQEADGFPGQFDKSAAPKRSRKTIAGVQVPVFWVIIILVTLVVAAAIGGGVGGSIAVKRAK